MYKWWAYHSPNQSRRDMCARRRWLVIIRTKQNESKSPTRAQPYEVSLISLVSPGAIKLVFGLFCSFAAEHLAIVGELQLVSIRLRANDGYF